MGSVDVGEVANRVMVVVGARTELHPLLAPLVLGRLRTRFIFSGHHAAEEQPEEFASMRRTYIAQGEARRFFIRPAVTVVEYIVPGRTLTQEIA